MVFSSVSFLFLFLPAFLICYTLLPWRNLVALLFSLLFFAWGEGTYLLLLLASIALNYFVGQRVGSHAAGKVWLTFGVGANLVLLAYFKYFGFLVAEVLNLAIPNEDIPHLPLGISFLTFQALSYLIDVYRRDSEPADSLFKLALYIAMFPQLIAGPIVRYASVSDALNQRAITTTDIGRGCVLFVLGLSYKVLIANNCAEVADAVFALEQQELSRSAAWIGVGFYTLQIFFDFAGYSLMAIGLGRVMGFRFPNNFNYPYVAQSLTEFWRRWHISLSSWFRDYLYIPLGGNRRGKLRTYGNLFLVFLLCGLWHGAAWSFVLWGMCHGIILAAERAGLDRWLASSPRVLRHLYLMIVVMTAWVLFRAEDLGQAGSFLAAMYLPGSASGPGLATLIDKENLFFLVVGVLLCLPVLERSRIFFTQPDVTVPELTGSSQQLALPIFLCLLLFFLCTTYVMSGTYNPFIYFRF